MRRIWKFAAGGVIAAAAAGAYLNWLHDWRPSCSNVPSAAAAAEWLNGLASYGTTFTAEFVACATTARFMAGGRQGRGRHQFPGGGILIDDKMPPARPEDLAKLKDLPRLRSLGFLLSEHEPGYADAAAAAIGQYKSLRELYWRSSAGFTDAGLRRLAGLDKLEYLTLHGAILGDGPEGLAKLPRLRELALWDSRVTATGMARLADLRSLERIELNGGRIEGSLAPLARLPALRAVLLFGFPVDDAMLASLAGAPALESLDIWDASAVTDEGLAHLARLPKLRWVGLERSKTTAAGMARLRAAKPDLKVALR